MHQRARLVFSLVAFALAVACRALPSDAVPAVKQHYVVFEAGSKELSADDRATIARAAADAKSGHPVVLKLLANDMNVGSAGYFRQLH